MFQPLDNNILNQTIEQMEHNPRLVGMAETILQQNAAILEINRVLVEVLLKPILIVKTELRPPSEEEQ